MANEIMSVEGQLVGMPLAGPESFSAQQLDYLKRALGVDETVLWSGTANQTGPFTLNEAYTNFQYVQIKYQNDSSNPPLNIGITKFPTDASQMKIVLPVGDEEPSYKVRLMTLTFSGTSATVKNNSVARYLWNTGGSCSVSTAATQAPYITEIVGIHRIAGGN